MTTPDRSLDEQLIAEARANLNDPDVIERLADQLEQCNRYRSDNLKEAEKFAKLYIETDAKLEASLAREKALRSALEKIAWDDGGPSESQLNHIEMGNLARRALVGK